MVRKNIEKMLTFFREHLCWLWGPCTASKHGRVVFEHWYWAESANWLDY